MWKHFDSYHIVLTVCHRDESLTRLDNLKELWESNFSELSQILQNLQQGVQTQILDQEARNQISQLLKISTETRNVIVNEQLLKGLAFDGMTQKFDTVAKAYAQTYQWILDEGNSDPTGVHLRSWLSSGSGVFHIAGKPGSGKSTLMKLLCQDERTQNYLKSWAGNKQLIFAKFFFMKPVKATTNPFPAQDPKSSIHGLLRSLLYQVLKACPAFSRRVLPEQWSRLESVYWRASPHVSITNEKVETAFSVLLRDTDLYSSHKICIFVDGLDELDDIGNDFEDLVLFLKSWPEVSSNSVKLCVSSRELNAFQFGFSPEHRFRVQELTKRDIEDFIEGRLADNRAGNPQSYTNDDIKSLVYRITSRSQGVFLWVKLATHSVRQGMLNGNAIAVLKHRIDHFHLELQGLFQDLMSSIHPVEKELALKTFALIRLAEQAGGFIPLLWYNRFDTYLADPEFAYDLPYSDEGISQVNKQSLEDESMRKLNGRCMGLVDVAPTTDFGFKELLGVSRYITLTHRSVLEFLDTYSAPDKSEYAPHDTKFAHAVGVLFLAYLKSTRLTHLDRTDVVQTNFDIAFLFHNAFTCMAEEFQQPQEDHRILDFVKLLNALNDVIIRRLPHTYNDYIFDLSCCDFRNRYDRYAPSPTRRCFTVTRPSEHISTLHLAAFYGMLWFLIGWMKI